MHVAVPVPILTVRHCTLPIAAVRWCVVRESCVTVLAVPRASRFVLHLSCASCSTASAAVPASTIARAVLLTMVCPVRRPCIMPTVAVHTICPLVMRGSAPPSLLFLSFAQISPKGPTEERTATPFW